MNTVRIERRGESEEVSEKEVLIGEGYEQVVSPLSPSSQRRLLSEKEHLVVSLAHSSARAGGIGP